MNAFVPTIGARLGGFSEGASVSARRKCAHRSSQRATILVVAGQPSMTGDVDKNVQPSKLTKEEVDLKFQQKEAVESLDIGIDDEELADLPEINLNPDMTTRLEALMSDMNASPEYYTRMATAVAIVLGIGALARPILAILDMIPAVGNNFEILGIAYTLYFFGKLLFYREARSDVKDNIESYNAGKASKIGARPPPTSDQ